MIIFDIETGPQPLEILKPIFDRSYEQLPHPGQFDPAAVKHGNTKDEAKRAAKIAEEEAKHAAAVAEHESRQKSDYETKFAAFVDRAALCATTGRVVAIGFRNSEGKTAIPRFGEAEMLAKFWERYCNCRAKQEPMVGCNSNDFDLPFLIRRSWMLGLDVPRTVRNGRWFDPLFIDIREVWLCGQPRNGGPRSSLDHIGECLGIGGKLPEVATLANGDEIRITGANFWKLWESGNGELNGIAMKYLLRDLEVTAEAAKRLGVG